jgi:DNA gyrase/topoisomerase IV subunit B
MTEPKREIPQVTPQEHVRARPGMYFGGPNKFALHQMIWYVLDAAIWQADRGYADHISILLQDD